MNSSVVMALFMTGCWLGLSQVALGFHLIYCQGATVFYYFILLNVWLAASIVGVVFEERVTRYFSLLHMACMVTFALASVASRFEAFSPFAALSIYVSAGLTGMFAGWFLAFQAGATGNISRVLLHENNGFLVGYAVAGCLLFFSITGLDAVVVAVAVLDLALLLSLQKTKSRIDALANP